MTDEQFNKLLQVLGQVGSMAYQAAQQRVWADAITSIVMVGLCLAVIVFLVKKSLPAMKERIENWDNIDKTIVGVITSAGLIASSLFGIWHLANVILIVSAPNYYALTLLGGLVK